MGLSIDSGPKWKDDSHGYINRDASEMNILDRRGSLGEKYEMLYSVPEVNREDDVECEWVIYN